MQELMGLVSIPSDVFVTLLPQHLKTRLGRERMQHVSMLFHLTKMYNGMFAAGLLLGKLKYRTLH